MPVSFCVIGIVNTDYINLSGKTFDVRVTDKNGAVAKYNGVDRKTVILCAESIADGAATEVSARDQRTGKLTVFMA